MYRIGILTSAAAAAGWKRFDELIRGLAELGYADGRNVELERRYAEGRYERLPALGAVLVQRKVDVIVCMSTLAAQAARDATQSIPIVFATVADPVAEGFARSQARPGGNATGISSVATLSGLGLGAPGMGMNTKGATIGFSMQQYQQTTQTAAAEARALSQLLGLYASQIEQEAKAHVP